MLLLASPALALASLGTPQPADAMGAPCPAGSNLYPATIVSAIIVYEDAYAQHNVTIDIVKHPNATLDIESESPGNHSYLPIYSSSITFSTVAVSDFLDNSTGVVDNSGMNGSYDYQGCISPVQASTTYTVTMSIVKPASHTSYSQIVDALGGASVEFWIHWVHPGSDTTTSSLSISTSVPAAEFPSDVLPLVLSAAMVVTAFVARSLRHGDDSHD